MAVQHVRAKLRSYHALARVIVFDRAPSSIQQIITNSWYKAFSRVLNPCPTVWALRRRRIMQANYSIVETTAPGDTRRRRRRLGSDKRRGELNARPYEGRVYVRKIYRSERASHDYTRDIYAVY